MCASRSPHDLQLLQHLALLSQPRLQLGYLLFPARVLCAYVPLFQQSAQQVVTGALQQSLQAFPIISHVLSCLGSMVLPYCTLSASRSLLNNIHQ